MSDFGVKASATGHDIKVAQIDNIDFTSQYPLLKASIQGTVSRVGNGSIVVSHNLGYAPAYIVTVAPVSGFGAGVRLLLDYNDVTSALQIRSSADTNNLTMTVIGDPGSDTYNFYYYIFVDQVI